MKQLSTEFKSVLPNREIIENSLKGNFPEYKVSYSRFSDIWKIENKTFTHQIWYYKNKISKLITKRKREYTEAIILYIIWTALLALFLYFNRKYLWIEDTIIIFIIWGALTSSIDALVFRIKPEYKEAFQNEHEQIFSKLARLISD